MKSTVEQINPVQYRVHVQVTSEEVNQVFDSVFRVIQKKARVQGFRPGKAPLGMIRKLYTDNAVGEVHEKLVNQHLSAVFQEQSIRPIASPVLEEFNAPQPGSDYAFKAVVDVLPELKFDDYKGLSVQSTSYVVTDESLDQELLRLRRSQARTRPADPETPAGPGMMATVSHSASLKGEKLPSMDVKGMNVALGFKELFEGLETAFHGMKAGESKTTNVTLPHDYPSSDLAGQELEFQLSVENLQHLDLPELDDELAKDLEIESADALKNRVRDSLEHRAKDMTRQTLENRLLDKVLEMHPFEVPPALVDQVIDSMIQEYRFKSQEDLQSALRNQSFRENLLPAAKRRTQNTLILWHIVQKEGVKVTDDEVEQEVQKAMQSFGKLDVKTLASVRANMANRVRDNLLLEKAMSVLIDSAKVEETVENA